MIRVELFLWIGFLMGVPFGMGLLKAIQKYLTWRDARLVRVRVAENLHEVKTETLINELSYRADLTDTHKKGS